MARKKISQLESATDVTASDFIQIVDVEDSGMAVSGTNKKATAQLLANELGKLTNVTATGSTTARSLANRFADTVNVKDFGDSDGIGNVTLNVPSQYPTIQAALDYLLTKRINSGTTAVIQVADGTYNLTSGLNFNHPDGERIQLLGNTSTPSNCVLSVAVSGFDCLFVSNGHRLGLVNGFKFLKTAKALAADNTTAILSTQGSVIICGSSIIVDNWYYGIAAREHSHITCHGAQVNNSGDVGVWAFCNSEIFCNNAISNNAADVANNLGFGFQAEYGSVINGSGMSATGCRIGGIASLSNSNVRALSGCVSSSNTGSGFFARDGATIECHGATANNNSRYGVEELADGHVYYSSITATGNTISNFSSSAYFDNGALGARIVTDNGNLRIDNSGAFNTFFHTSGGIQFGVVHSNSSVNRFEAKGGATGIGVYLSAQGLDANIASNIESKGSEVVRLISNTKTAFQAFSNSSSNVNYVQANSSSTGNGVALTAQGSDSVVDLIINPKGSGSYVQLGTGHTSTTDVPVTGYIQIKDDTGTVRKLAVIA
jgi:hypothetical protein